MNRERTKAHKRASKQTQGEVSRLNCRPKPTSAQRKVRMVQEGKYQGWTVDRNLRPLKGRYEWSTRGSIKAELSTETYVRSKEGTNGPQGEVSRLNCRPKPTSAQRKVRMVHKGKYQGWTVDRNLRPLKGRYEWSTRGSIKAELSTETYVRSKEGTNGPQGEVSRLNCRPKPTSAQRKVRMVHKGKYQGWTVDRNLRPLKGRYEWSTRGSIKAELSTETYVRSKEGTNGPQESFFLSLPFRWQLHHFVKWPLAHNRDDCIDYTHHLET